MGIKYIGSIFKHHNTEIVSLPQLEKEALIDGDLLSYLYDNTNVGMQVVSENYDSLMQYLKRSFGSVVVYFDGSSDNCKVETSRRRRKRRAGQHAARKKSIPITKMILKKIIKKNNIRIVQCWGEADSELATAGQQPDKVIISRDTDFLCLKTNIIFYDSLHWESIPTESSSEVPYISSDLFSQIFELKTERERQWIPPLVGALTPNDYAEADDILWVYDKLYPGISCRQLKQMSEHDDQGCSVSKRCRLSKLSSVSLVEYLRSIVGSLPAGQPRSLSDVEFAVKLLDPPEKKEKKILDALEQFCPEIITSGAAANLLPERFKKEYREGLLDCDFSDMYLSTSKVCNLLCFVGFFPSKLIFFCI